MEETREFLIAWMERHIGPKRPFRNPTEWAKKAEIPASTLHRVYETGSADATTVIKLARSVGESPVGLLVAYKILDENEVNEPQVSPMLRQDLEALRALQEGDPETYRAQRQLLHRLAERPSPGDEYVARPEGT